MKLGVTVLHHLHENGCGLFIIHQEHLFGCFWLVDLAAVWISFQCKQIPQNSQNILSSTITDFESYEGPCFVCLSMLNLYYNAEKLEMVSAVQRWNAGMEHLQNMTSMGRLLLCWKPKCITENLISVPAGSVLQDHIMHVRTCVCVHIHHNQTITGLIFSMITLLWGPAVARSVEMKQALFCSEAEREQERRGERVGEIIL